MGSRSPLTAAANCSAVPDAWQSARWSRLCSAMTVVDQDAPLVVPVFAFDAQVLGFDAFGPVVGGAVVADASRGLGVEGHALDAEFSHWWPPSFERADHLDVHRQRQLVNDRDGA